MGSAAYRAHFKERLGFLSQPISPTKPASIWLHAVSLGEVVSALPLIRKLKAAQPGIPIYLSTSTVAGRKAALRQATGLVDAIFYSPIDYSSFVRRIVRTIRPGLVIVMETEIWPNLYAEVRRYGAKLAVVNGRISDKAWPRYISMRWFFQAILDLPDLVFVQSPVDFDRYSQLGVPAPRLALAGNLKYEAATSPPPSSLRLEAQKIWIAASTVGPNERGSMRRHSVDEDVIAVDAFRQLVGEFPGLLLVLAPRQPDRFAEVANQLAGSGLVWKRRSELRDGEQVPLPGILLLDTIGELAALYTQADVVFVGGSIAPRGGHNIIEPGAAGVPVVVGQYMRNFEAITRDFVEAQGIVQIKSAEELAPTIRELLNHPRRAGDMGKRAQHLVRSQQGVSETLAKRLWPLYCAATPRPAPGIVAHVILRPLSLLWKWGGAIKRSGSERRAASLLPLPVPVISIGGITIGGSGKTPFTNYLTAGLKERGYSPAILTRGYGRRFPAESLVFPPGAKPPTLMTGDEAQIFLRAGLAPLGIGAKRYETAQVLMRQFPATNVLLLDDGFQHARIDRDFDVVMIDGLDPFGKDELVPLGRLREPLSSLRRAGAFVITRAENELRFNFIRDRLREFNPAAPAFRTRLIVKGWRDYRGGAHLPSLNGQRVGGFCGLGNPRNFWLTLESLGLDIAFRWTFADHHSYKPDEIRCLAHQARAHGASFLVTTEKDIINCPGNLAEVIAPIQLAWLEIALELENEGEFFEVLEKKLRARTPRRSALSF